MMFPGLAQTLTLLVLLAASLTPVAAAQPVRVQGRAVDAATGDPLPGVNVFVPGTTRGDATDREGSYAFDLEGAGPFTVSASMLGYETASATVADGAGDTATVAFRLVPAALGLGAVEVITETDEAWRRAMQVFEIVFVARHPTPGRRRS